MRAASSGEAGIICKAASTISIVNGNHSQVSAMTIAVSAQLGSVISEGTGRPMKAMKRWKGLMSTAYMTRQRMPTTMGGSTIGMRKPERAISRMRLDPFSNNATPRPTSSCRKTVATDSFTWIQTERVKRGSSAKSR
jgi:hypothetical protein